MNVKNTLVALIVIFSIPLFGQKNSKDKGIKKYTINTVYLDSIKKTFVRDQRTANLDSLWVNELLNIELYNNLTADIENFDPSQKVEFDELPTDVLKSRLQKLDAKSPFHIEYTEGLENLIKSFLKNRKKSFEKLMGISEVYFPMFEEVFAKHNIPLEIKYLSIVESALNPKAISRVGATGLWQFMYATGKQYKLNIDSYIDERNDPIKSTDAAARYFKTMYDIFGDWDLVLASYNSGPGNVTKAIRRAGGQQNFWNIKKHLPKETQGYVPAFLATMYLYEFHKEHGITPNKALVKHFQTDTIAVKREMSFDQLSLLLDVPVKQLQLLNPNYKRDFIPTYTDRTNYIRLPLDKIAVFTANENKIYDYLAYEETQREKPLQFNKTQLAVADSISPKKKFDETELEKFSTILVKKGETLSSIADDLQIDVKDLKKWNHLKSNKVAAGKSLKFVKNEIVASKENKVSPKDIIKEPKKDSLKTSVVANALVSNHVSFDKNIKLESSRDSIKTNQSLYTIQKGEGLFTVAKKFGITVDEIKKWNPNLNNKIVAGTNIIIRKSEDDLICKEIENTILIANNTENRKSGKLFSEYKVQKGDTLNSISKDKGISISKLRKLNNITQNKLKEGMVLKLNG